MKSAFRDQPTFSSLKEAETSSGVLKKVVALLLEPEKTGWVAMDTFSFKDTGLNFGFIPLQ